MKFPRHECGMYISHNEHKDSYQTAEQFINFYEKIGQIDSDDWVSEDEKKLCIKNNEIWSIQWYPDTPVGFCKLYGSTLESILNAANK